MTDLIHIGHVTVPAVDYAVGAAAVLGIRDSGKTVTTKGIAEQLLDRGIPLHGAVGFPHSKPPVPVTIVVKEPFPECRTLEEAEALHTANAEVLTKALYESLPQGTLHKVLWLLMGRYAKHLLYRGRVE